MIPFPAGYTYTANEELSAGFYIFVAIVAFVGALTIAGLLMWHNFRLPKCCFAQRQVCYTIDCFESYRVIKPAREALRALGLLLADGTPTVGGGKTF